MASIRKTQSGKWSARVSIKGKAHSVGTFPTKKAAQEAAAKFEGELKPIFAIANIEEELEKELAIWKKHLEAHREVFDNTVNSGLDLAIEAIEIHIESIEKSIRTYSNKRRLRSKAQIQKLPSFNVGGIKNG